MEEGGQGYQHILNKIQIFFTKAKFAHPEADGAGGVDVEGLEHVVGVAGHVWGGFQHQIRILLFSSFRTIFIAIFFFIASFLLLLV